MTENSADALGCSNEKAALVALLSPLSAQLSGSPRNGTLQCAKIGALYQNLANSIFSLLTFSNNSEPALATITTNTLVN